MKGCSLAPCIMFQQMGIRACPSRSNSSLCSAFRRFSLQLFTVVLTYLALTLKMALALGAAEVYERIYAADCPCLNVTTTTVTP